MSKTRFRPRHLEFTVDDACIHTGTAGSVHCCPIAIAARETIEKLPDLDLDPSPFSVEVTASYLTVHCKPRVENGKAETTTHRFEMSDAACEFIHNFDGLGPVGVKPTQFTFAYMGELIDY